MLLAALPSLVSSQTMGAGVDSFDDAAAQKITNAINAQREKAGLPQLEVNPHLNDSSKLHALEVAKHTEVSDQYPGEMDLNQRIGVTELGIAAAAENVAINPDVDAAAERFAGNEVTRTNMLNPKYTDVGAAVLKHDGRYYIVANMVEALSKIGIDELENTVIRAIQTERKDHKIAPLNVVKAQRLRTIACDMAQRGKLSTTQLDPNTLGVGAGFSAKNTTTRVVSFTVIQPKDLPAEVTKLTGEPNVTNFSVGACKSQNEYYVTTVYYFDVRQYLR
jgi:hypothetical protein